MRKKMLKLCYSLYPLTFTQGLDLHCESKSLSLVTRLEMITASPIDEISQQFKINKKCHLKFANGESHNS